jgi:hypothetical protein
MTNSSPREKFLERTLVSIRQDMLARINHTTGGQQVSPRWWMGITVSAAKEIERTIRHTLEASDAWVAESNRLSAEMQESIKEQNNVHK